jgi:RNA polymerase sigma factor (sigma-70 family)
LIEGPIFEGSTRAYICRACVELCAEIFEIERARAASGQQEAMGPDSPAMQAAQRARVDEVLAGLDETEREVIKLFNGLSDGSAYTYDEIAIRLDLPAARVAEIYAQAIAKLPSQGPQPVS